MSRRRTMAALAAARQERERQQGVKMGYAQNSYSAVSTRLESSPIPVGTDDFTIEYYGNLFGSAGATVNTISNLAQGTVYQKGCLMICAITLGVNKVGYVVLEGSNINDSMYINYVESDPQKKFHLVLTRSGRTVKVYINGVLNSTKQQSSVKDFPSFRIGLTNSSDIALYRHFNYALSAPEVAVLYNNGRPEDKVLPGYMKVETQLDYAAINWLKGVQIASPGLVVTNVNNTTASFVGKRTDAVNNTIIFDARYVAFPNRGGVFRIVLTIADNGTDDNNYTYIHCLFRKKDGSNVAFAPNRKLVPGENVFYFDVGEQVIDNGIWNYINYDVSKRLDVTIDIRVYAQGCIAEYLPQNIVTDRATGSVASWLDSARQLPAHDEYLPPLLQSIGGFDLAASGAPEIIHKSAQIEQWQMLEPMTLEGWIEATYKPMVATIENGAIKVPFPIEDGQSYMNGVWRALPFEIPIGCKVTLRFKARSDMSGNELTAFIGRSGSGLYAQGRTRLTTEWKTYESPKMKDTSANPLPLMSVGIYPTYNKAGVGNYYFKDIEVLVYKQ